MWLSGLGLACLSVSAQTQRSGQPTVSQYVRVDTPHVVTPEEIDEVQLKVGNLHFDILTLVGLASIK